MPSAAVYRFILTQALSLIGSRMSAIAIGIRVFQETGQAAPLLLVAFFNELPPMLLGSAAGVLVDRWPRRRVLLLADAGQALGTLLLAFSFLSNDFQLWHLYAVAFFNGCFAMFQGPAQDAALTHMVPEDQRDQVNGLRQMAFPLAGIIAPALTGLLYPLVNISGIILIDMITFLLAVLVIARLPFPSQAAPSDAVPSSHFWTELRQGLAYLGERRALLGLILYFTALNFLLNGPLELALPYLIRITGSETLSGLILAAMNGGALAGGMLVTLRRKGWSRVHVFLSGFLLTGFMFIAYGWSCHPLLLALSLFLLMIPLPLGWGLFTSLLQGIVPPEKQGRIFSVMAQLGYLASTTSFLLTGALVDQRLEPAAATPGAGMSLVLIVTGVVILLFTLLVAAIPALRQIESRQ